LYWGALIIGEVVYAELITQFERKEKLDEFLRDAFITLVPSTNDKFIEKALEAMRNLENYGSLE